MTKLMNKKEEIKNRIKLINEGKIPEGYKKLHGQIIPQEWNSYIFKEVFKEQTDKTNDIENYPLYSLTIENGVIPKTEQYERSFLITKDGDSYKIVKENDFVMNPMNLRFGAIARYKGSKDCSVSGYYNVFSIINKFDNYYMETFLKSQRMINYYNSMATGSLIEKQRVHYSQFEEFNFCFPNIVEQEKIAEILKKCDKVIELKEKLLIQKEKKRKKKISNYFNQIQNSPIKKLGDVCNMFSGGTPNIKIKEYYNGNIPFIKSGEIECNNTESSLTELGLKESSAKFVNKGDLLFALYGANSGNVAISKINGAINQAILCIRSSQINSYYLMNLLKYNKEKLTQKYLQGGQGNLSAQIIKTLKFPIPSLCEQEKFTSSLLLIDKKIELLEQELEQYKQLKKALSQLLLIGIVRVSEV